MQPIYIPARLHKSTVKAHQRRTKSGKIVNVREHQDKRTKTNIAQMGRSKGYSEILLEAKASGMPKDLESTFSIAIQSKLLSPGQAATLVRKNGNNWAQLELDIKDIAVKKDSEHVFYNQYPLPQSLERALGIKAKNVREWRQGYASGKVYVTTDLDLKGRGITQSGDGSDHARGLKTYHMTQTALKKVEQQHGKFTYQDIHKSKGNTMDLSQYPALRKAMAGKILSKSLEFTKPGKEIIESIHVKIGACQLELISLQAEAKVKAAEIVAEDAKYTDRMETIGAPEVAKKEPDVAWEIRNKIKEIETLRRIARNLDPKKTYKLSECDLKEYGF